MDFKDWRTSTEGRHKAQPLQNDKDAPASGKYRGKHYHDYIDEQIRQAQERGEFDNLRGAGKPLKLEDNSFAGDNAMGYGLLKSNGFAPAEIELANEIRRELERAETKLEKLRHQSRALRSRRIPPFARERQAFNLAVKRAAAEYESTLRELNSKILTLNLIAPAPMHQPMLAVDKLVQDFRTSCPLFD